MIIKDLNKLLELLSKLKDEPDYEEFFDDSYQSTVDNTICAIEAYKDFLGDDKDE